ncbi:monoacylglycerol lipase ABHD6 [Dioscorea cayenensis subsp. rotundata]|uniref:Monoacylglycerol lipase ABHD6 n=1 Tax=Dioscorea cayennensis subsp. rotundata TaxID=55577 RepID=A0AB40BF61_DIOCR|nr:monoacylglycerol lipase ABHD6 [Dioscorea cayenensis subsp. rotundata]
MAACLSFTATRDRCNHLYFSVAGLRSITVNLSGDTIVRCWVPSRPSPAKPKLLLIHGFGANATWQWTPHIRPLLRAGFDLYVPDLLFFGGSFTSLPARSDSFQAETLMSFMESIGVERFGLVGVSYGGFVGYWMAAMYPEAVERLVLCCAGVCLEERDLEDGLFVVRDVNEAASILLPQTPDRLRRLVSLSFVKPPPAIPSLFLADYIHVMCTDYLQEKTELIHELIKHRRLSDLPKINQPTLIVWGEQDQIFPLELGYRLKRHLDENSQLVIIKEAGHAVNLEKAREFYKHIIAFMLDSSSKSKSKSKATMWHRISSSFRSLSMKNFAPNYPLLSGEKTTKDDSVNPFSS